MSFDFTFIPTTKSTEIEVPYFEDARADFAPYYAVRNKSLTQAQAEVTSELAKLGASVLMFQEGKFQSGRLFRHGYSIHFMFGGRPGLIRVAGLPIRMKETDIKVKQVKLQALYNVRDWLKTAITNRVFSPGSVALIPFMLADTTPGQERTVADMLMDGNMIRAIEAESRVKVSVDSVILEAEIVN